MKTLKEITQLLARKQLSKIEILNGELATDSPYSLFYHGIKNGKYKDDETAARDIYHANHLDKRYTVFKSRFKEKLLNTLFFLDIENQNHSPFHKANYKVNKDLQCAKILFLNNARNSAVEIIHHIFPVAIQYQFAEQAFACAKLLRNHASLLGLKKDYEHYSRLANEWLKMIEVEGIAENCYESIIMEFVRSVSVKPQLINKAKQYLKTLRPLAEKYDSSVLHFNRYRIWIMLCQMEGNYKKAILICNRAQQFLKDKKYFYTDMRMAYLEETKLECCLYLRDYKNGKIYAEEIKKYQSTDTTNWLVFLEYYFLLAMHTGNYKQAEEILHQAVSHHKFASFTPDKHEKWKIFEAYLFWMLSEKEKNTGTFNLYKFMNEVPIYSKDKQGYNVAILIAQILFMMDLKEYPKILDKEDTLKAYRSNYLRAAVNFRSNRFIKMLLLMIRFNFKQEPVNRAANKILKQMRTKKILYQGTLETLEVIPYEILWEKISERLKKK